MRYAVFSDIHSNLEALEAVILAYQNKKIDSYLCVGDIVGYGANPNECIQRIQAINCTDIVAGNHDWASVGVITAENFNLKARKAVSWTQDNLTPENANFLKLLKPVYKNQDLILAHGSLNNPQDFYYMLDETIANATFELMDRNLCFVGHTHKSGIFIKDKNNNISYQQEDRINIEEGYKYIINVGSVGQPRDGNPEAAYSIYDVGEKSIEIKRVSYDIRSAREKIIRQGLPRILGDRLLSGI